MIQIYQQFAQKIIPQKVAHYAKQMNCSPSSVKINAAKSHWRSCSHNGRLNFSWRLIMASSDVVDYVVVHELAHIKAFNHSSAFWELVKQLLSNYKESEKKLKTLRERLNREDWD